MKKVLILGRGPSLDAFKSIDIDNIEDVILMNNHEKTLQDQESFNKLKVLSILLVLISLIYLLINYSSIPWVGIIVGLSWSIYSFLRKKIEKSQIVVRTKAKDFLNTVP